MSPFAILVFTSSRFRGRRARALSPTRYVGTATAMLRCKRTSSHEPCHLRSLRPPAFRGRVGDQRRNTCRRVTVGGLPRRKTAAGARRRAVEGSVLGAVGTRPGQPAIAASKATRRASA